MTRKRKTIIAIATIVVIALSISLQPVDPNFANLPSLSLVAQLISGLSLLAVVVLVVSTIVLLMRKLIN